MQGLGLSGSVVHGLGADAAGSGSKVCRSRCVWYEWLCVNERASVCESMNE